MSLLHNELEKSTSTRVPARLGSKKAAKEKSYSLSARSAHKTAESVIKITVLFSFVALRPAVSLGLLWAKYVFRLTIGLNKKAAKKIAFFGGSTSM
jgi:hypothetical protein